MDDKTAWDVYFAGVCSIRFHPKNDMEGNADADEIEYAAQIADTMLKERKKRWPAGEQ